jgi:HEAT repeat protein
VARLGIEPNRVVPLLAKASRPEQDSATAPAAVAGPYDADPEGSLAIPLLVESLKAPEGKIVTVAAQTLGKFGPKTHTATAGLIGALSSKEYRFEAHYDFAVRVPVRTDVARSLGEIGAGAVAALAALTRMMREDVEPSAQLWAVSSVIRVADHSSAGTTAFDLLLKTGPFWPM